jgi:hypothetical protein
MRRFAALLCTLAPSATALPAARRLAPAMRPARSVVSACTAAAGNTDHMATAVSADGSVSAKAVATTNLVGEATRLQGLGGLAAAALGRALTCSLLVADGLKDDETFQARQPLRARAQLPLDQATAPAFVV